MRLILGTFWTVTYWAAGMFAAPLGFFVYLLTLVLRWTGTRRSNGTRRFGRGRPDTAIFP
jgi:hypothetical protein